MLKYLTHKLRTQSINENQEEVAEEDNNIIDQQQRPLENGHQNEKPEGHDSGTESDGEELERRLQRNGPAPGIDRFLDDTDDYDIEIEGGIMMSGGRIGLKHETSTSSSDPVCSLESPQMFPQGFQMYDPNNSSEEELEVINGPRLRRESPDHHHPEETEESPEVSALSPELMENDDKDKQKSTDNDFETSNNDDDDDADQTTRLRHNFHLEVKPKTSSMSLSTNTITENRKRSLANTVDDEVCSILDILPGPPVNFRTSPPLEALKPHRSLHIFGQQLSKTPSKMVQNGGGININSSDDGMESDFQEPEHNHSNNKFNNQSTNRYLSAKCNHRTGTNAINELSFLSTSDKSDFEDKNRQDICDMMMNGERGRNEEREEGEDEDRSLDGGCEDVEQELENFNLDSIRISYDKSPLISTAEDLRSVSPPAKLFHCAVSPRRRPLKHYPQRVQRQHRPCLDFDKMQQLKTRSVSTWRHNNEHTGGELSVYCW